MKTTYELQAVASCPIDESVLDVYDVVVTALDVAIPVERILETVADLTLAPILQEDLTRLLADRLGAAVTTTGFHSGVRTVCES